MRLKTMNKRRNRNIWKRRGHTHIKLNRGNYTWFDLIDHDAELGDLNFGPMHLPYERMQPRCYTHYPHA